MNGQTGFDRFLTQIAYASQRTVRQVNRAHPVTQASGHQADVLDNATNTGGQTSVDLDLVADAVTILEKNRQSGEVVVDLVLTTNGQTRTDEAGTRQEECRVDVEDVEHRDQDTDPHDHREEMVNHARRGVGPLLSAILTDFTHLEVVVTSPSAPPTRRMSGSSHRQAPDHPTHHEMGDPGENRCTHDDDGHQERLRERVGGRSLGRARSQGSQPEERHVVSSLPGFRAIRGRA